MGAAGLLAWHVLQAKSSEVKIKNKSLAEEARHTCHMKGNLVCVLLHTPPPDNADFGEQTTEALLKEVERLVRVVHTSEDFISRATIHTPPENPDPDALIGKCSTILKVRANFMCESTARYRVDAQALYERTMKLLTRKVQKCEMGASLVRDVETLVKECQTIARSSGK